jgi:hypothetical protein
MVLYIYIFISKSEFIATETAAIFRSNANYRFFSPHIFTPIIDPSSDHRPAAAVLLLPRSLEPRWSSEAYRLMEERSRALTNMDEAAVESISGDAMTNSSDSGGHTRKKRTVAADLHALNRDLMSAATLLNEPVTFEFPMPSSASSVPSVPASSNDPSLDPHAARQRLIDEQARRMRRLIAALFPDAADFVVAVRDPFDFDAVAAHAKLRHACG